MTRWGKILLPLAVALSAVACDKGPDAEQPVAPLDLSQPCDVKTGCEATADGLSLRVSMGPEMRALAPFPVSVEAQAEQRVDSVTATFAMQGMDMGVNRYQLISDGAERWLANVTLPVCTSGRSDWIAILEITTKGRRYALEVPFAIGK